MTQEKIYELLDEKQMLEKRLVEIDKELVKETKQFKRSGESNNATRKKQTELFDPEYFQSNTLSIFREYV